MKSPGGIRAILVSNQQRRFEMKGQEKALEPGEALFIGVDLHKEIWHVTIRTTDVELWSGSIPGGMDSSRRNCASRATLGMPKDTNWSRPILTLPICSTLASGLSVLGMTSLAHSFRNSSMNR
jgi:hypothetical protein